MLKKICLSVLACSWLMASPVLAADAAADKTTDKTTGKTTSPPDLTGVWERPKAKGFAFPNEVPAVLRSMARTEAAKTKMAAYSKLVPTNPTGPMDSPGAYCLGAGMPTMSMLPGGYPMEIIQRPEQITMLYELDGGVRRIYMTDRLAPADRIPSRPGYSTGKWEGDTLVVETTSLTDTFDGDQMFPHGEQAVIVERYRLGKDARGNKVLNIDTSMTDPESYTKPVQISTQVSFMPNGTILNYACELWDQRLESLRANAAGK